MVRQLNADNEEELIEMEVEVEVDDDEYDEEGTYTDDRDEEDDYDDDPDADVDLLDLDEVGSVANESVAGESLTGEHQRTVSVSTQSEEQAPPPQEIDWLQLAQSTLLPGDDIIAAGGGGVIFQEYIDADEDLLLNPEIPTDDPALNFTLNCHRWALNHQAQTHDASYRLWQAARFGRVNEDVYLQQLEDLLRERIAIVDSLTAVVERRRRERAASRASHAMITTIQANGLTNHLPLSSTSTSPSITNRMMSLLTESLAHNNHNNHNINTNHINHNREQQHLHYHHSTQPW
jgi:hypothetical protein